ncbi:MAG TPA: DUF2851 family protein [Ktedonobacterales bacterium]|nr:DUF2851 family protein [Ktedonobacterales bacterium]
MPRTTTGARPTEAALAARWRAGEFSGRWLRTTAGEPLRVLFAGRPGGPAGPDFRDAVLARGDGTRLYGDVELHLRAAGWRVHGHARDHRYDGVVLHVVARAEGARATPLASGAWAPLVEIAPPAAAGALAAGATPVWPCQREVRHAAASRRAILLAAGEARCAARVAAFAGRLADEDVAGGPGRAVDRVLLTALAEGLAYGRDRAALRQAGEWLAGGGVPDALTRELPRLPRLDATRLEALLGLCARWGAAGPWAALRRAIGLPATAGAGGRGAARDEASAARDGAAIGQRLVAALVVGGGALSPGRAAILVANVALPCGVAIAEREGDAALAGRLWAAYRALPGLPGNQITRAMVRQLGLGRAPAGACAQQGLHHIWARHCREKRCDGCPCATPPAAPPHTADPAVYCAHEDDPR